ncbi:hypothetical protein [Gimesia sp.]|uniref:hypothetical protein n=1 Tax=Gimesia sp. TaxID=2024833 RepID=UPI003A9229FA
MIDRERRNQLAALIRRYLDGRAPSTDFGALPFEYYKSDDPALIFVADELPIQPENDANALTKQEWDYIQRLLLLLESNSTVSYLYPRYRSWTQSGAAVLLFVCLFIVLLTGFSWHLFLYFIPVGLATILLLFLGEPVPEVRPFDHIVTPFHSITDLGIAYDSANFVKQRYHFLPRHSRENSSFEVYLSVLPIFLLWICVPPILLFLLCCLGPDPEVQVQPG